MEKQHTEKNATAFRLPDRLITSVDLMRTIRELKSLDDWLNQAAIRSGGQQVSPPKTSATLDETAQNNSVSLLDSVGRQQLIAVLESFAIKAPKIHISFAVEPSANFLSRMIIWLRTNISPVILLDVGLQPALAAGCSVRTTNKLFDMSLRNRFTDSRHFLLDAIQEIEGMSPAKPAPTPTPEPVVSSAPVPQATTVTPIAPAEGQKVEVKPS